MATSGTRNLISRLRFPRAGARQSAPQGWKAFCSANTTTAEPTPGTTMSARSTSASNVSPQSASPIQAPHGRTAFGPVMATALNNRPTPIDVKNPSMTGNGTEETTGRRSRNWAASAVSRPLATAMIMYATSTLLGSSASNILK